MTCRPSGSNLQMPWNGMRSSRPLPSLANSVRAKPMDTGLVFTSSVNMAPASSFVSPPVVRRLPANLQVSSTPTPPGVVADPSRSAAVTIHSPWNGSYSADRSVGFDPTAVAAVGSGFAVSLAASLGTGPSLAGPPARVALPENWNPATAPANRTAAHAAPALSLDANMAVRTPSVRTMAETDAALMPAAAAAVDAVSASGTMAGATAVPMASGKP